MFITGYDLLTILMLLGLVLISVYIGYRYQKNNVKFYAEVVDEGLDNLKDDGIIIIKEENGQLEIYSGYKHDPNTTS